MAAFPISRHEKAAVGCAAVSLAAGLGLALLFEPAWLNRSGSVLIVIGVLLAASRLTEVTEAKLQRLVGENFDTGMDDAIRNVERVHGRSLNDDQRDALRKGVYASMTRGFGEILENWRRRVKRYEVSLVVAGTLVNGFGDWVLCLVATCAKT